MLRIVLLTLALAGVTSPVSAQSLKSDEVFSSFAISTMNPPNPVLGADGRNHLAYELLVTNASRVFVTLDRIETVSAGKTLATLEGEGLSAMIERFSGEDRTVPPGGTAIVFMDVSFAAGDKHPASIAARVMAARQNAGADGKPTPLPADSPIPASFTFTGADAKLGAPAVVIEPPLRGKGWLAVNGCCDAITSHRGAVMAVNGVLRVPERFAIDWLQLNAQGRLFTGDINALSSYAFYGTPVHAVANGRVVNLYDGADEQVPAGAVKGITAESIGGNMLVIDIGGGAYAFYAHMQRGSLKVKLGEHVRAGDVIGLLGNTGNTDAPHLHFHVMDGTSPLDANSLPYVFTRFTGVGVAAIDSLDDVFGKGLPAKIDASRLAGPHIRQLPLNNQVVDFD